MTFAGDDDVLELLSRNVAANTPKGVARVEKLVWGGDDPLAALGLDRPPDLLLASDVVYGNDPVKWRQLVKTMRDLSGPRTLVVVGNVQRYPVHHPMAETRFFEEATAEDFIRREVPTTGLHPDFRRTGGGSCVVHLFRRRPESIERARGEPAGDEEAARERKRKREGKEKKSGEGKEKKKKKKKKKK